MTFLDEEIYKFISFASSGPSQLDSELLYQNSNPKLQQQVNGFSSYNQKYGGVDYFKSSGVDPSGSQDGNIFTLGMKGQSSNRVEPSSRLVGQFESLGGMKNLPGASQGLQENLVIGNLESMILELEQQAKSLQTEISQEEEKLKNEDLVNATKRADLKKAQELCELGDTKQEALEKYIIELQKQFTDLERSTEEKQDKIEELCHKDWAKNMESLKLEMKHLGRIKSEKQAELSNIQKYASNLLHKGTGSPNVVMLEEQSKELSIVKKQLLDFENRNNDCKRKWKDLYQVLQKF